MSNFSVVGELRSNSKIDGILTAFWIPLAEAIISNSPVDRGEDDRRGRLRDADGTGERFLCPRLCWRP